MAQIMSVGLQAKTCNARTTRRMPGRCKRLLVSASKPQSQTGSRASTLRELLQRPGILQGPCCHDGLSAKLIEDAGCCLVCKGRYVNEATKSIPIIGDGDTGYGNALNVKRTVRGYAQAGFAGILIEDQVMPKACGHTRGRMVTTRDEAVARIRAAVDARNEGADILILARTDARQAESLEEALWRAAAFADAGADILFVDALESVDEMRAFCKVARTVPKMTNAHGGKGRILGPPEWMANMLEGGGKTPILSPARLEELGYKLVAYPLSLLGVSIRAMQMALEGLKDGRVPSTSSMGTFLDIQRAVGFPEYYTQSERYAAPAASSFTASERTAREALPVVEPEVATSSSFSQASSRESDANKTIDTDVLAVTTTTSGEDKSKGDSNFRRNNFLRVCISDNRTGMVKLETRIPAGFLQGLGTLVPQAAGMNVEALIKQAIGERWESSRPLVDFNNGSDNIKVFLE